MPRGAEHRVDPQVGEPRGGEQEGVAQQVVEAAAVAAEDEYLPSAGDGGRDQRQFQIRCVLVRGVTLDAASRCLHPFNGGRVGRVEIAHEQIDVQPEPLGLVLRRRRPR